MPEANDRVTNAILATKLDSVLQAQLLANAHIADMRVEQAAMRHDQATLRQEIAVNQERWTNHRDLHRRERTLLGVVSAGFSAAAAAISLWWKQ